MKRNVKLLSILMVVAMLLTSIVLAVPVFATGEAWDGTVATGFAGGTGTQDDPYQISSAAELAYLATYTVSSTAASKNEYFKVTVPEIDLNNVVWTPIGIADGGKRFEGNFDGNGVVIKNLNLGASISNGGYTGLFGVIEGATIKGIEVHAEIRNTQFMGGALVGRMRFGGDSTVSDCDVYVDFTVEKTGGETYWGGAVGMIGGNSTIENVNVYGTINVTGTVDAHLGGIVGRSDARGSAGGSVATVKIINCTNYANITSTGTSGTTLAGGILGTTFDTNENDKTEIKNCVNYGSISAITTGASRAGGMVGDMGRGSNAQGKGYLTIENCVNLGTLKGNDDEGHTGTGSMVSCVEGKALTITNCFSTTLDFAYCHVYSGCSVNGGAGSTNGAGTEGNFVGGISLETLTGARVRIDTTEDGTSGLRFDSKISTTVYDALNNMNGVKVTLGTVIAPSANIAAVTSAYDKIAALDAAAKEMSKQTYIAVPYKDATWVNNQYNNEADFDEDANYFTGAVGKIFEENYNLNYSAVAYLTVTVGEWSFTFYANDGVVDSSVSTDRVRSVAYVGHMAYADGQQNEGLYTEAQMGVLKKFSDAYEA